MFCIHLGMIAVNTDANVYMMDKIPYLKDQIKNFIEQFNYNEESEFYGL